MAHSDAGQEASKLRPIYVSKYADRFLRVHRHSASRTNHPRVVYGHAADLLDGLHDRIRSDAESLPDSGF